MPVPHVTMAAPDPADWWRLPSADAAVALVIAMWLVCDVGVLDGVWPQHALGHLAHPVDALAFAGLTLPLAFRHRAPCLVAATVLAAFTTQALAGHFWGMSPLFALLIALYTVWAHRGIRAGLLMSAIACVAAVPAVSVFAADKFNEPAWEIYGSLFAVGFLGDWARRLRAANAQLAAGTAELASLRDADLEHARKEERLRVARDLHDITAHSLGVMTIQAGAARTVLDRQPDEALAALAAIETTGRGALGELGQLFEDGRAPAPPGLDGLEDLATRARDAGLHVETHIDEPPHPLPPGLEISIYRLVQEALTNAAKHAGPTRVLLTLRFDGGLIDLAVVNEPPAAPRGAPEGSRRGLVGMRERAALFGGSVDAARRSDGSFAVHVRVPLVTA